MSYEIKDRLRFLAEASKILSSSLDYNVTLANVAKLVVNYMADFCMIDLLNEEGKMERVAARSSNPKKRTLTNKMFDFPADPRNKEGIYYVAQTKKSVYIKDLDLKWLKRATISDQEREIVHKLEMNSFIFSPLVSRNKVIGVITIVSSKKGFFYSPADVLLAEEIGDRAGIAVDKARLYREAQEALRIREEFMSIAAHELRTPLTIILLHLQKAMVDIKKKFDKHTGMEQIVEMLEKSEKQGQRLSKLIGDLLDVSLVNTGKLRLEKEKIELNEFLQDLISRFKLQENRKNAKIILRKNKTPVVGFWDKVRIEQVILNLLSNAVKYGRKKPVRVSLKKEGNEAVIQVKDDGIGIRQQDRKDVFELFRRSSSSIGYKGIGIGLYISKQIVEAHKGTIALESRVDKGTTFTVRLPLNSD